MKKATPNTFTLNAESEALMDRLIDAKLAKSKSALVRDALTFYETKVQIDALLVDFTQMPNKDQYYMEFFDKIKELMQHV